MRAPRFVPGLVLVAACSAREAPLAQLPQAEPRRVTMTGGPGTVVVPATAPKASDSAAAPPSNARDSGPEPAPGESSAEPEAEPHVVLERPYSALGHPRLATEMLTLARDEELFQWALGGSSDPNHPRNHPGYHPATRVVIDVELLSRAPKGSTKRLQALARSSGYWPVRSCFEAAQRLAVKLERTARVRVTLSATGRVLGARSFETGAERAYARCVLERVRALDFRPGFTRKLDFELRLKQWPGHAPVPPRAPEKEPPLSVSSEARAALEGVTPALTACYRSALASDGALWGRLALKLRLSDGNVIEAEQVETRLPSDTLVSCARQAVLGARIPGLTVNELTFAVRFGQPPPAAPAAPEGVPGAPPPPASPVGGMSGPAPPAAQ
ncbi:MAG TPA: hypothetical protein VHB79_12340 [Polyangiaceae bacterium]|nr:hypothetical protein [Polyangiaceae bacterium]